MPFESLPDTSTPSMTILLDGTDVTQMLEIVSLETCRAVDKLPYASIILRDGDPAQQTFAVSEGPLVAPGAEIILLLGYSRNDDPVFKGIVTRQRLEAPLHGSSRLHIEAKHTAFRMAHARKSRVWQEVTDSDAIADLAEGFGISFDPPDDPLSVRPVLVQHQTNDWDFAVTRAQAVGMSLLATDDGLTLIRPEPAPTGDSTITYGSNVFAIEMELNTEEQPVDFHAGAWDPATPEVAITETTGPSFVGPGDTPYSAMGEIGGDTAQPRVSGPRDMAELDDWAYAQGVRRRISAMRGTVEVQGAASYQPGQTVTLEGLGTRFNGPCIITGVRQQFARGDWRSFLQLGLDPATHHETMPSDAPAAGGLLPAIRGLQIGTVETLEGDPAGEERVAVRLVTETESEEAVWARPLSIGGGKDRGLVMLPEEGDEVLLGFLDDDPRDAILLGGVHSSANASPFPGASDNHIKGVTSRSGIKISFDDDGVILLMETPNGQSVTLDDAGEIILADSNNNTISLNSDGITLESGKDLILSAQGDVKISSNLKTEIAASGSLSLEGGAESVLKSSGPTTVKGAVVQIN